MEIGQTLRQARQNCGLTQEGVAERVGVSRQTSPAGAQAK